MARIEVTICDRCQEEDRRAVSLSVPKGAGPEHASVDLCPDCLAWAFGEGESRRVAAGVGHLDMGWLPGELVPNVG